MPFWLTFFLFLSGGIWTLYAILMHDIFLGVPCGMGFLLGAAQLVLYGMYRRNAKALRNYSSDLLEQGWSNQPPIAASHEEERCNDTKGQDDT
ncbi:SWEET sugar transporter [Dillenia turbinata]|uniref:SWEET sugar transporter n=1 Tax=Dillenia turbinata TaxID=194707 RepID=A0AAN8YY17_9MAGN